MYLRFYQLNQEPFQVTPDPDFLFPSRTHREALAAIVYGVEQRKGFIAVTGDVGLGKTTVLRSYLAGPHGRDARAVYIYDPDVTFDELLTAIYIDLDLPPRPRSTFEALRGLHSALIAFYQAHETVVLVVDEAQNMPEDTLESLRMLSNLETASDKLIQIILCGQSEFEERLRRHSLRQLRQRIAVWARLKPLSYRDSADYIRHRLDKAAFGATPIMTKGAVSLIARASRGVPRTLNILADNVLVTGFGYDKRPVTADIAKEVIADQQRTRSRLAGLWRPAAAAGAVAATLAVAVLAVSQSEQRTIADMLGVAEAKTAAAAHAGLEAGSKAFSWLSGRSSDGISDLTGRVREAFTEQAPISAATETAVAAPTAASAPTVAGAEPGGAENRSATQVPAKSPEPESRPAAEAQPQAPVPAAAPKPAEPKEPAARPANSGAGEDAGRTETAALEPGPAKAVSTPAAAAPVAAAPANREAASRSKKKREREEEYQPVQEVRDEAPALQPGDATWVVHYGDTASKIIIEVYGAFSPNLLRLVQEANPHIPNLNILDRGDLLILPMVFETSPRHVAERYGR